MPDNWTVFRLQAALVFAIAFLLLSLLLLTELTGTGDNYAVDVVISPRSNDFSWLDIEPTTDLVWHSCFDPLLRECARLIVPLNYADESSGNATLALIRVPSPYSSPDNEQHSLYRGPILFNPGGPGGSGVDFIVGSGDLLAQILGPQFDLVSFDPRGVARSTPKVMFFDAVGRGEREVWDHGHTGLGVIRGGSGGGFHDIQGENGRSLEGTWADAIVRNRQASERAEDWLGNVNTEQTANDMLSIVKAHGRDKLMYWGFSYGSLLGSTFASLFPDKIERMVLDGVVDADNYYATLWTNNLLTTPKTLNRFFQTCYAAGPACAFWAPSVSLIAANLNSIYNDLITNPIPVRTSKSYGFLGFSKVRSTVFMSLYTPWAAWPTLAQALANLKAPNRDATLMWQLTEVPTFECPCSGSCDDKDTLEKAFEANLPDAQTAIVCSDGVDIPSDVGSARSYFENFTKTADFADVWSNIRLSCSGWPKAKKGFQGPTGSNTSFPLLFIGNTEDPVTPAIHAQTTSGKFPGSRVLTQNSPGHCSLNAPSVCTGNFVKDYFVTGNLPLEGTVCQTDSSPFPPLPADKDQDIVDGGDKKMTTLGGDDASVGADAQVLKDVMDELSKAWKPFNRAFLQGF